MSYLSDIDDLDMTCSDFVNAFKILMCSEKHPVSRATHCYTNKMYASVRVVFSVTRMRSSNSAHMNKINFTTEKIGSVHMTVFEIVAHRNVDDWIQLLT